MIIMQHGKFECRFFFPRNTPHEGCDVGNAPHVWELGNTMHSAMSLPACMVLARGLSEQYFTLLCHTPARRSKGGCVILLKLHFGVQHQVCRSKNSLDRHMH